MMIRTGYDYLKSLPKKKTFSYDKIGAAIRHTQICLDNVKASGEKVFLISEGLVELLKHTDVSEIPMEFFKPPFENQFFHSPAFFESESFVYSGFFICDHEDLNEGKVVLFVGHHHRLPGHTVPIQCVPVDFSSGDLLKHISSEEKISRPEKTKELFKFVFNVILYINSSKAEIKEESWTDIDPVFGVNPSKAFKEKNARCLRVGCSIKLNGDTKELIRSAIQTGKTISVRFLVRGHWRHQWMGSDAQGDRRQELIWIQPFWKGDPLAEYQNKPYELVGP